MRHILAYGNSDQASFRHPDVRDSFDYMSVPGTIASYYADATAAFVLSSQLDYLIDPRTPLFQNLLEHPRASHVTLAAWLGPTVRGAVSAGVPALFNPTFYDDAVIREMVTTVVENQINYADRAGVIQEKLDRYSRLLAQAMGSEASQSGEAQPARPSFVLAPYFAVRALDDPWQAVNEAVWAEAADRADANDVSAVVCVADPEILADAISLVPSDLSGTVFFWVTGFDERRADLFSLRAVWDAVRQASQSHDLINLYGGFFSVCMQHAGLWGFNNGLGYSESRDWPQLEATGAAPPRYYMRDLHIYLPVATAQALVDANPALECPCPVCADGSIVSLGYHDLKRHFALARRWELQLVDDLSRADLTAHLVESSIAGGAASEGLPSRLRPDLGHLRRWERVIREAP